MASPEIFTAEITLPPSDLIYGGYSATGAGVLTLNRSGDALKVQGQAQTETLYNSKHRIEDASLVWDGIVNIGAKTYEGTAFLEGKEISGEIFVADTARMNWDGVANLDTRDYAGKLSVESEKISSDLFSADAARVSWDGNVSTGDETTAKGYWTISAEKARTTRRARAAELADTLSLFPALSVVPVAEHFAPDLKVIVEGFFLGANVTGEGDLEYGSEGFKLTPKR